MTVFEGLGLSSQIGDLGSYFISLSIMIIYAVKTNQPRLALSSNTNAFIDSII